MNSMNFIIFLQIIMYVGHAKIIKRIVIGVL
jgi:hypothetical protein